ncbi:DNA cytosine methyltransferase [Streptomyces prunicolor]|uniref:DNA cytosine methyltransferase n=1 Tax=Streptomyces prunicolor TaxID=67348 RepID=UPI00343AAE8D
MLVARSAGAQGGSCAIVSRETEQQLASVSGDMGLTRSRRRLVAIDLFAGVGGLSLGFEQAGFDVLAAVEYDPVHAAAHQFNFPLTEVLCRDVRNIGRAEILGAARHGWRLHHKSGPAWDGVVDVIVGGPSCQGFSTMGRRDQHDERNDLLLEFVRIVVEVRPRSFCLENVPGLLQDKYSDLREAAFARLRAAGYRISGFDRTVNAAHFGVPQNRKRVVIMGALEGEISPLASSTRLVSVAESFSLLPDASESDILTREDSVPCANLAHGQWSQEDSPYARYMAGIEKDPEDLSRPRIWDPSLLTNSRLSTHAPNSIKRFSLTPQGSIEPVSRFFRLSLEGQARTLRAGTGRERGAFTSPRPLHPVRDRVITVREAARLHSFPDWFRFHVTSWHGHRQIGNSVPPLLARAAAQSIARSLESTPSRGKSSVHLGDEKLLHLSMAEAALLFGARSEEIPAQRTRKAAA